MLDHGADVNRKGKDGSNALFLASLTGNTDIVRMLLDRGATPDIRETDGTNAILITARDELVETIYRSLYKGLDEDGLFNSGKLKAMISKSGDGDLEAVSLSEFSGNDSEVSRPDRTTAFIKASQSGHVAIVKVMVRKDTHLDQENTVRFTDLMVASMNGHDEIVKLLKEKGAGSDSIF